MRNPRQMILNVSGITTPGALTAKIEEQVEALPEVWDIKTLSVVNHGRSVSVTALIERQPYVDHPPR